MDRSERLREAISRRQHRKMLALALDLSVNESAISRWKNGGAMSLEHASRICVVLDISMDWLILGRGDLESHKSFQIDDEERMLLTILRQLPPSSTRSLSELLKLISSLPDIA